LSIHSDCSKSSIKEMVGAGSWQMGGLDQGYMPQFNAWTERLMKYKKSSEWDMEQVLKKVRECEEERSLEEEQEQPWCTNPLSVVENLEMKEIKKRVVLDTSRHLLCIKQTVQMEDLKATGVMMGQGKFMSVIDLNIQFFQVRLVEEVKQLFELEV